MAKGGTKPWRVAGTVLLGTAMIVFWHSPVLWPLKIVVVLFHELSHAIAAWLTGGEVRTIGLGTDQSGVTRTVGGWRILILNAGYTGSLLWGVALRTASHRAGWAKPMLALVAGIIGLVTLGFVRPFVSFGFVFALLVAAALSTAARRLSKSTVAVGLEALGTFSVLYALLDIRDDVLSFGAGTSDATALAAVTSIPAVVWGLAWIAAGAATLWLTRRW